MNGRNFSNWKELKVYSRKVLIVGTGALATLFAAKLSARDVDVILLGTWTMGLETLKKDGARVEGEAAYPVRTTIDPVDCRPAGLALVLVKSWQTERAARQLGACLSADGLVVSLQNGLGNDSVLTRYLGQTRVARGITTLGAYLVAPGVVRVAGEGPLWLEQHPRIGQLASMMQNAGFRVEEVEDIRPHVWGKLIVNAAINPLTSILRVKNGKLLTDPLARNLMRRLANEAAAVAESQGVELPFADPERTAEEVAENTRENYSSMLRDILRDAPTEVDAINGEIVRLGHECGLGVSVNMLVWNLVLEQKRLSSAELSDMVRLGSS